MPKARVTYGWTAGGSKDIVHEEFIASGGFGEVHKVPKHMILADRR